MTMKKTHDLVAVIKREGRDKPNYIRCGAAFVREDGSQAIKVDSVPACDWNGWFSLYEPRDERPAEKPQGRASRRAPDVPNEPLDAMDDPLPF